MFIPASNPSRLVITESLPKEQLEALRKNLTYTNKSLAYQAQKFRYNKYYRLEHGQQAFEEELERLKAASKICLLDEDANGWLSTYSGLAGALQDRFGWELENQVQYPDYGLLPWHTPPTKQAYPYQRAFVDNLKAARHGRIEVGCHRFGQKVLMADGSLRAVQDVVVGEQLMGPDSKPRNVLELRRGLDTIWRLETVNRQVMEVNGNHILVLRSTKRYTRKSNKVPRKNYLGPNREIELTVNDYLARISVSKKFKHLYKTFSVPIVFPSSEVPIDPYFLGVLIGDGSFINVPNVTTMDPEIRDEIYRQADVWGLEIKKRPKPGNRASSYFFVGNGKVGGNHLKNALVSLGLWGKTSGNKFIPQCFSVNSEEVRLAVLAGLIDTDGSYVSGCYDYISKSEKLAEQVCYLSRSLGLRASVVSCVKADQNGTDGTYWRVTISGQTSRIPVKIERKKRPVRRQIKDCTSFGFSLTKVSDSEEYYGFILDGDSRYLTDTFLVTHNTGLGKSFGALLLVKEMGLRSVIMTPSTAISEQLYNEFSGTLGRNRVGAFFDGKKDFKKQIVIANAQSLARVLPDSPAAKVFKTTQVFLADESHQTPAKTLADVCLGLFSPAPYRFFLSATQLRGDGAGMLLDGITGPTVFSMTVREGVDQGYLAKPIFHMVKAPATDNYDHRDSNVMTRHHLLYNPWVAARIGVMANHAVDAGMPVLVLIDEVEQFTKLLPYLQHKVAFAHGTLTDENRPKVPKDYWESDPEGAVAQFNEGKVKILVGTSCISTGVDVRPCEMLFYWKGGMSEVEVRQGVGRGTRKPPGKTLCHVVDFRVTPPAWAMDDEGQPLGFWRHADVRAGIYDDLYGPVRHE